MITATNLTLGNNLPQSSGPISFSWLKACGNAPGFDVTYLSTDGYRVRVLSCQIHSHFFDRVSLCPHPPHPTEHLVGAERRCIGARMAPSH